MIYHCTLCFHLFLIPEQLGSKEKMTQKKKNIQTVEGAKDNVIITVFDNQLIQILYPVLLFTFLSFSIHNVHPREFFPSNSNITTCGS